MLVYDEIQPLLDDSYEGDEVALLAVRGGRVDKNFRRNYAWAKHAADRGVLKKIVVKVAINRDGWVHTVGAVTSALSGQRLHEAAVFGVDAEIRDFGDKLSKVLAALDELKAPAPTFSVATTTLDVEKLRPRRQPRAPKAEDAKSDETPSEEAPTVEAE